MFWRGLGEPDRGDNRRKAGRVFTQHVECSLGEVLDLSATGLRVRTKGRPPVSPGDLFSMTIKGYTDEFSVMCQCAWVKKTGWFSREIGVLFAEVSPEARARLSEIGRTAHTNAECGEDFEKFRRAS